MTDEGTDRPWERPGQAAQGLNPNLADSKTRGRQYEYGIGSPDRAAYQQTSSPTDTVPPARPRTSNAADDEGRVGDPPPVALLVIAAVPIVALIAGVVWWTVH